MIAINLSINGEAARSGGVSGSSEPGPPAPSWTELPAITPQGGMVGDAFTAVPGTIADGTLIGRAWLLDGAPIAGENADTLTPQTAGTLVHREYANGAGGTRYRDSAAVTVEEAVTSTTVTAMVMGQSELEHVLSKDSWYRQIPQPVPGDGNLIVFTQAGDGVSPARTVVNAASVAAGQVSPAMAAISALLDHAAPGVQFVIGDGAVGGTSRYDLADDTTNGSDDRWWSDFTAVAELIEAEFGSVGHLVECWYSSDGSRIPTFKASFWPFYFGANDDGSPFTLGGTVNGRQIDHCLFDAGADPETKGRGLFARADTSWHMLMPMPFHGAPTAPDELDNFSSGSSTMVEPRRAILKAVAGDALAQSVDIRVGPSAHVCRFGGVSSDIHPSVENADGVVLFSWPIAIALLRASGMTIGEPSIVGIEGPTDGSYAELIVDLPNGGDLTTLAALRGTADIADHPHQQAVTGVEVIRSNSERRPLFRPGETERPESHRGTVAIVDAGSGNPRRGRVRITPAVPFAFGEALSYLRGQATASLQKPRDQYLYPWMLIEHVPALYDASATYPFEGIAVQPYQDDLTVPVEASDFEARGAYFDGASYFASGDGPNIVAGSQGLMSVWVRNNDSEWNAVARRVFQLRVGSSAMFELYTASSGRMTFRLNSDTGPLTAFYAAPDNVQFQLGEWHHIMAAWTATGLAIYVDGVEVATKSHTVFDMDGATLSQMGIGAYSSGTGPWLGDIGHLYINVTETLDLSMEANRDKFALAGAPADLGANGQLPTGNAPAFYYDGDAPAWANQGTAGNITATGIFAPSTESPQY